MDGMESKDILGMIAVFLTVCFTAIIITLAVLHHDERTAFCGPVVEPDFPTEETDQ